MSYTREGEILKCPWHQWEFDIKTGQALYDPKLRVRAYRVEVEGEKGRVVCVRRYRVSLNRQWGTK